MCMIVYVYTHVCLYIYIERESMCYVHGPTCRDDCPKAIMILNALRAQGLEAAAGT